MCVCVCVSSSRVKAPSILVSYLFDTESVDIHETDDLCVMRGRRPDPPAVTEAPENIVRWRRVGALSATAVTSYENNIMKRRSIIFNLIYIIHKYT